MRKLISLVFFAATCFAHGQTADSSRYKGTEYKYVGIQANLLLQQFINFNSNSSINTNPYLFSFSKNNVKTGEGLNFGTGFLVTQNASNDGVSSINTQNVNITLRLGYERKYFQEQRFVPFWGIDFGIGGTYSKTVSQLNQSFNFASTTVETSKLFIGPAFRGGLLLALSKHVFLGTEFFFNMQIAYSNTNGGGVGNTGIIPFNIGFQTPTALFLTYRY